MSTPNNEVAQQVSQTTGVTAEAIELKRTGAYVNETAAAAALAKSSVRQATSTVNPFGSIRK
jgi:hypothetical protein